MTVDEIEHWLMSRVAEALQLAPEELCRNDSFAGLGLDSLTLLTLTGDLASWLGRDLPVTVAWENPSIAALALALSKDVAAAEKHVSVGPQRHLPLPLSYGQEQMWKECHTLTLQGPYVIYLRFIMRGELRIDALRHALDELVCRHEILRTTFHEVEGRPVQAIHPPHPVPLEQHDLRSFRDPERKAESLLREIEARKIDLESGPLFYAILWQTGPNEHRFVLVMHHLLGDFRSCRILYRELGALYAARTSDGEAMMLAPTAQMADYACAERAQWDRARDLYSQAFAAWCQYWHPPLPSANPAVLLRWRRVSWASATQARRSAPIAARLIPPLLALASREETTLFTVLLAVFASALRMHTMQEELIVGTHVSTRRHEEAESLGFFINRLPMRLDLRTVGTFCGLLQRVKQAVSSTLSHQRAPLADFAEDLRALGGIPPSPEIHFQLLHSPTSYLQLKDLDVERWKSQPPKQMPRGFMFTVHELGGGFSTNLAFDATRYRPAQIAKIHGRFLDILQKLADIGDLPLPSKVVSGNA